ncbi:hypothetical protein [Streptomyces sp. NPDC087300]|uniref:hypothetical protein n=1 Tax=Streptomyces sp. NPDC087300 TaxID=3365780 RepID=UPI0037FF5B66
MEVLVALIGVAGGLCGALLGARLGLRQATKVARIDPRRAACENFLAKAENEARAMYRNATALNDPSVARERLDEAGERVNEASWELGFAIVRLRMHVRGPELDDHLGLLFREREQAGRLLLDWEAALRGDDRAAAEHCYDWWPSYAQEVIAHLHLMGTWFNELLDE